MKFYNEIKNRITKGDIIVVVSLIIVCVMLFAFSFGKTESLRAEIYVDGEKLHSIALSEVTESYTVTESFCRMLIEKDGVSFVYSDCLDQLCVKRGKLKNQGDTMACVPEKIVIILRSDSKEKIDSVAY